MEVKDFLDKLNLHGFGRNEKIIKITQAVSSIPWGEYKTTQEVLNNGCGACTGKHKLLQDCLEKICVKSEPVVVTFRWEEQPIKYSTSLRKILSEGGWKHGHNFVHLVDENLDLDVTWNRSLEEYGFPVLPEIWDGKSSFISVDHVIRRWDNAEIDQMKEKIKGSLDEITKERRSRFLKVFIEWVDSINFPK